MSSARPAKKASACQREPPELEFRKSQPVATMATKPSTRAATAPMRYHRGIGTFRNWSGGEVLIADNEKLIDGEERARTPELENAADRGPRYRVERLVGFAARLQAHTQF